MLELATERRRAGRRPVCLPTPRATRNNLVVLWFVCTRRHWSRCRDEGAISALAADGHRPHDAPGLAVALHGTVGSAALSIAGACRDDLVAVALRPASLPGSGPDSVVRVDVGADARVRLRIAMSALPFDDDLIAAVEPLRPLPDEAGYFEPTFVTRGDVERAENRDGLRRTR